VCVVGKTIHEQLFAGSDPVNKVLKIGRSGFLIIGGVLGVMVGFGLGNLVTAFTEFTVHVPLEWAARGLVFCTVIGVVFGMWPAVRASRLVPIEALRYE
jgi:ABC-type antimicrobial peptide transport system permease subunit